MSIKHTTPRIGRAANKVDEGDIAILDRDDQAAPGWRPRRIERRDWHGEGVVSTHHTD